MKSALCIGHLLWLTTIFVLGIWLFTQGFLLKRFVIEKNSTCKVDFIHQKDTDNDKNGCWMHKNFKKAVVIVIDALRYDFAAFDERLETKSELVSPFKNKLTIINELIKSQPLHSRLFRFIADPPTTTLQRLKGLTTGSLPTFIDAGSNFAGTSILEDNWIDQLVKNSKDIVFMGDDTWMGLYPTQFKRKFPFPSFNVKDLHTVDNGVLKHLIPQIRNDDWDVLIAHFLGVDHCGHRFGPNHEAMADKLGQMNIMLRNVTSNIDKDTILFVFGDHGMTKTGDHGGDSDDELDAAMFIYSPSQITSTPQVKDQIPTVSQVDFVPTISLLLGVPIPFSNLGQVIPELFNHCPHWNGNTNPTRKIYHTVKALHLNAHQVHDFLVTYDKTSSDLPQKEFQRLLHLFKKTEVELQSSVTALVQSGISDELTKKLIKLENDYKEYIVGAQNMCRNVWAKFDIVNIVLGISTILTGVVFTSILYWKISCPNTRIMWIYIGSCAAVIYLLMLYMLHDNTVLVYSLLTFGFCLAFISFCFYKALSNTDYWKQGGQKKKSEDVSVVNKCLNVSAIICFILQLFTFFSNSYVVFENDVINYLLKMLITVIFYISCSKITQKLNSKELPNTKTKVKYDIGRVITSPNFLLFLQWLFVLCCLRSTKLFESCREEQWTCEINSFTQSLSALSGDMTAKKGYRLLMSVCALSILPILLTMWMRRYGNLNGYSPLVLCVRYMIPFITVNICLYWAVLTLPGDKMDSLPAWQQTLFPRLAYAGFFIMLIVMIWDPLTIYVVHQKEDPRSALLPGGNVVPKCYNHIKLNWERLLSPTMIQRERPPPMVYGLGTVLSAAVLVMLQVIVLILVMLLRDGLASGVTISVIAAFILLEIHSTHDIVNNESTLDVPLYLIVAWSALMDVMFFATGHQSTLPTIQWETAFIGFHGDHVNTIVPGILILANTFASHIIISAALPLTILWPLFRGRSVFAYQKNVKIEETDKGEFSLVSDEYAFHSSLLKVSMGFIVCRAIRMLGTMCAAGLHRRHLMVWKIFAPKFIFEGIGFLISTVVVILMCLFMIRVKNAVILWTEKLQKTQ